MLDHVSFSVCSYNKGLTLNDLKLSQPNLADILRTSLSIIILVAMLSGCHWSKQDHALSYQELATEVPQLYQGIHAIAKTQVSNVTFTPLTGGMTSAQLFVFSLAGKKYVLRTMKKHHPLQERLNEVKAHSIAESIGIAPKLLYVDPDYGFVIMDFVDGHTITRSELNDECNLKKLGLMLAKLHNYSGDFDGYRPQTARARKHYKRAVRKKGVAFPSDYDRLYNDFIREGETIAKTDQVLCHGDLNAANILASKTGEIFIIDWPSATIDNRYTDLGYLTFLNGLDEAKSQVFLEAYLGRKARAPEWEKLKQAQRRTRFLTSVVWFDFSESEEDKHIPKSQRVANLDKLLQSPDLMTAEDYIQQQIVVSPASKDTKAIRLFALGFLKSYLEKLKELQ